MAPPGQRIPGMWYPAVDDVMYYGPRKRKPTQQETDRREQEEHQKSLKKAAKQRRTDANESKKKATEAKAAGKIAATAARPTRKATADATTAREESAAAGTSTKRAATAAATTKKSKNAKCHGDLLSLATGYSDCTGPSSLEYRSMSTSSINPHNPRPNLNLNTLDT